MLKSKVPRISSSDLSDLEIEKENKTLFPFLDDHQRDLIWERLREIEYPIPTLETFFQDILYLDVGQCVMRQLCLAPPKGKSTIDKVLRSQYNGYVAGLISRSYWEQTVQNEQLHDLWRFSLQYAFELTPKKDHHRRVPRKSEDKERASSMSVNEAINGVPPLLLLRHFIMLARNYAFEVPGSEIDLVGEARDLPRLLPCDFPPGDEDEVETERRSGKPFTDSVQSDRFALSRESLRVWDSRRVSAGFVRRSVFRAFFSYLNSGVAESPQSNLSMEFSEENNLAVDSNELEPMRSPSSWQNMTPFSPSVMEDYGSFSVAGHIQPFHYAHLTSYSQPIVQRT